MEEKEYHQIRCVFCHSFREVRQIFFNGFVVYSREKVSHFANIRLRHFQYFYIMYETFNENVI